MALLPGARGVILAAEGCEEPFRVFGHGAQEGASFGQLRVSLVKQDLVDGKVVLGNVLQLLGKHPGRAVAAGGQFGQAAGQVFGL